MWHVQQARRLEKPNNKTAIVLQRWISGDKEKQMLSQSKWTKFRQTNFTLGLPWRRYVKSLVDLDQSDSFTWGPQSANIDSSYHLQTAPCRLCHPFP